MTFEKNKSVIRTSRHFRTVQELKKTRRIHNRRIGSREIVIVVVECVVFNDIWLSSPSAATDYLRKSIIRGDKPSPLQRYCVDNLFKLKQLHR